jgi:hypothetical protein
VVLQHRELLPRLIVGAKVAE